MAQQAKTLDFKLVSPEAILFDEPVALAVIPGEDGEFGIGPGHAHLLATLGRGVVKLYTEKGAAPKNIFIAGGFSDVNNHQCRVLAEEAVNLNDLDRTTLEQERRDLQEDIGLLPSESSQRQTRAKLDVVNAKLYALDVYG